MGNGDIDYSLLEKDVAKSARRSLFARRFIPEGKEVEWDDIIAKRPGIGIPVYRLDHILGRKSRININKDYIKQKSPL